MKEIHLEQKNAAKEIVDYFTLSECDSHYVILDAPTQSGKTGCFMGVINLLDRDNYIRCRLGIDNIFYITGDNQDIRNQTIDDFEKYCYQYVFKHNSKIFFFKNSDLGKYNYDLKNSLIIIDESHYGTKKEFNKVSQFLKRGGVDYMKASVDLCSNNTFILSVSATPYMEIINDFECVKHIVKLEVGDSYIGIKKFYENNQLILMDDKEKLKDPILLKQFFNGEILSHLDKIKKKRNKQKFVIMRNYKSGDIPINHKELLCDNFEVIYMDSKNMSESDMYWEIRKKCQKKKIDKYLLVIISGRFRMGKRFEDELKDYCGVVIDYSQGEGYETTEQGLLGRFCGYLNEDRTKTDWKDTMFYVSTKHTKPLIEYYVEGKIPTPYHSKYSHLRPNEKYLPKIWGEGKDYAPNIDLLKSNGIKRYNVTSVLTNKEIERLKDYRVKYKPNELQTIIKNVIERHSKISNKYLTYLDGGCRREPNADGVFSSVNAIDGGKHRKALNKQENYKKPVMKALLITNLDDKVYLEIQETVIDKFTYDKNFIRFKKVNTMDTKREMTVEAIIPRRRNARYETVA